MAWECLPYQRAAGTAETPCSTMLSIIVRVQITKISCLCGSSDPSRTTSTYNTEARPRGPNQPRNADEVKDKVIAEVGAFFIFDFLGIILATGLCDRGIKIAAHPAHVQVVTAVRAFLEAGQR